MTNPCPDRRFPAAVRLKRRSEFQQVFQGGRKCVRPFLVVHLRLQTVPADTRLGLTVSRRVGNAVTRNRVKRRLREIFRHARPDIQPGYDIVVVARTSAADATYQELKQDFDEAAVKLGLLPTKD